MKNKPFLLLTLLIMLIAGVFVGTLKYISRDKPKLPIMEGIESFSYEGTEEDHFLLFYPADWRVSQNNSLIREVNSSGELIDEYEILDEDFRRMLIHQKPNDLNTLYISQFGEAVIDNYFYTFDIEEGRFKKQAITYFTYDTGVNHIMHYGKDIFFSTIVSHLTGDQDLNPETGEFKMSFSNFTREESFETEAGREASFRPILQFQGKIIYSGDGSSADLDEGKVDQRFVAFVDELTGEQEYKNFGFDPYTSFAPLYAKEEFAYILASKGEVIVLDREFQAEIYEPFRDFEPEDKNFYFEDPDNFLMLDEERALFVFYDYESDENNLGLLSFREQVKFTPLDKPYINKLSYYRILYQDAAAGLIYLLERNNDFPDHDGKLLIIASEGFDLIHEVPVKYEHLLDMVIKK